MRTWTSSHTNTTRLENSHLDRRKSEKTSHRSTENGRTFSDKSAFRDEIGNYTMPDIAKPEIAIPRVKYINATRKHINATRLQDNSDTKNVNSTELFHNIAHYVNRKNSTYSNSYRRQKHSNRNSNSSDLTNAEKHRRDTSKTRNTMLKSKTVIRSSGTLSGSGSDQNRQRPRKDLDMMRQFQKEFNQDYYERNNEGGEIAEEIDTYDTNNGQNIHAYDENGDQTSPEGDKFYNHKIDRSLFDRSNHNYNPNNPIHSINQLYTSFQSADTSDLSTYATLRNRNIDQNSMTPNRNIDTNPMTPYFESSSVLPSFTTARSYHDASGFRRFPPGKNRKI